MPPIDSTTGSRQLNETAETGGSKAGLGEGELIADGLVAGGEGESVAAAELDEHAVRSTIAAADASFICPLNAGSPGWLLDQRRRLTNA